MKNMRLKHLYVGLLAMGVILLPTSCSDILDQEPLTDPTNETFLSSESSILSYINGLYIALPSLSDYGMGVRGEEKNSDNILSEDYDSRLNGEETLFSSNTEYDEGYENLRDANYFLYYYLIPESEETDEILSLKGEAYFFRAYWHFDLLKKFGDIPIMDDFWDNNATVEGLQVPQADRADVAKFILSDLTTAVDMLYSRSVYKGLRVNKEAAMLLAMQVALYEGSWEKYHQNDAFAADSTQYEYFFQEVLNWGDKLMAQGLTLNTQENDPFGIATSSDLENEIDGSPYGHLFNQTDYSNVSEAIFWKQYSVSSGTYHSLPSLLAGGIVDENAPAGVAAELVNTYLKKSDGTPIDPDDDTFKDFNKTFEDRDPRLTETIMSTGYKFQSTSTAGHYPMKVMDYENASTEERATINPPYLTGNGSGQNVTGYHIRMGVDTTYVSGGTCETGLILMRYAEALLCYAEAAEELGKCTDEVLEKTIKPLRERVGVTYVKPSTIDPNFTDYGYTLTANMQEIRRERRVELALQGFRFDDLMRWAGAGVIAGKRGRGAYLGTDGVLYQSFSSDRLTALSAVLVDEYYYMDPLQELLPNGYGFNASRDYLLPIPPTELELNKQMSQNPGW